MKEIRLGSIGSGMIVHEVVGGLCKQEGAKLEAVYSRSKEKGQELAEEFGASKVYTCLNDLFADEKVNMIYVASPNSLHYEQTKAALLAGKHVMCEKPFAPKKVQAQELVEIAREKGLILVDATPTAFLPNLAILKRELPKVGKLKLVQGNYSQYSSRYDALLAGQVTNVFNPKFAGGCLMDINYYNIYLNVTLFGKPETAVYYPNIYENLVDTSGIAMLTYDGFVSESTGAKDTWGVNFFQIEGEKGYIYVKGGSNGLEEIHVVTKESDETFNEQFEPNRWVIEMENMVPVILNEDMERIEAGQEIMLTVIETIEKMRLDAGIRYEMD